MPKLAGWHVVSENVRLVDRIRPGSDTQSPLATLRAESLESDARPALCPALPFEQLYEEYYTYTSRTLRHMGIPSTEIEDAAQEAWLAVHRQLGSFEGRSSHRTWLFGILLNVVRNRRRLARRRPVPVPLPEHLPSPGPDPELAQLGADAFALVQRFLVGLDEPKQILFVAHLLEDFTAAETAELLSVDVATVYHRVRALRHAFRRWLEQLREAAP